jgi:hypothetical protein
MVFMDKEESVPSLFVKISRVLAKKPFTALVGILFIGLILRVLVLPNPGFEADISFWKSWGLAQYDHGIVWSIENTNNNYPTAFAYVLGVMTRLYSLFADPHNYYEYWSNTNLIFLTISKLPSILADYGIVAIIIYIGTHATRLGFPVLPTGFYVLLAGLYLANPVAVLDGAWWGQVDSLGVFIYLLAALFAIKRKPFLAGVIYMFSLMTKLQNMIYGPVFFILVWQLSGFSGLVRGVAGAVFAFVGYNWEFFIARKMNLVFQQLTVNYDYFPFLSLNAYNLWWIVAKGEGMKVLDKFATIGMTNAKTIGLYLFSSGYLLATLVMAGETLGKMFKNGKNLVPTVDTPTILYRFFSAMMLVALFFFLFQTESHDRYAFPALVFMLFWGAFYLYTNATKDERLKILASHKLGIFVTWYVIFSLIYFFNLHTALIDNYPYNGIPFLVPLNIPAVTIAASYLQLGLFAVFLVAMFKHVPKFWAIIPVISFTFLMLMNNLPLILGKPVFLTRFFPIISRQDYGKRQTDMAVNSFTGIKAWNPLSVQYYFYDRGIGTHAKSYHAYHINGLFKKFTVDAGIDTEAGAKGSATFEIYGDDRPLYISKVIKRYETPTHIEVDVTGVKMLGLVTNDGGDGINDDHTDWLNPILWP